MPAWPKVCPTQTVASETTTNSPANSSAVVSCNGFAAGIARSWAEPRIGAPPFPPGEQTGDNKEKEKRRHQAGGQRQAE